MLEVTFVIQQIFLLVGILVGEWLILYNQTKGAQGYFWPAVKQCWNFLLLAIFARWVVGVVLLGFTRVLPFQPLQGWAWAVASGLLVIIVPNAFDNFQERNATATSVKKWLVQILLKLNLLTGQIIRSNMQKVKEQDSYDCQNSLGIWNFGISSIEAGRRIRIVYEVFKVEIANKRRKPDLIKHDVGISPGQKFYLLAAHLGRKGLKEKIKNPPPPPPPGRDWVGNERRRKNGTKKARRKPDKNSSYTRSYDDKNLLSLIERGEAFLD